MAFVSDSLKPKWLNQFNSAPGAGDWGTYDRSVDELLAAADEWSKALAGIERPWLCWNVSSRWCELQQRLVQEVGWTPVVGCDPRYSTPKILPGSVAIDFNAAFGYKVMYFHFPLEVMFRFADRLAFWHSDLLVRVERMHELARLFESLRDGEVAAVKDTGGRRYLLTPSRWRYWELVGCTTRGASRSQWEHGAGWWRPIHKHPNCPPAERNDRSRLLGDHGFGIMYWKRKYGGRVHDIRLRPLLEGHCTSINRPDYKRLAPDGPNRQMGAEIDLNYDIEHVATRLGLRHLLGVA
jgi:hypothetical protein